MSGSQQKKEEKEQLSFAWFQFFMTTIKFELLLCLWFAPEAASGCYISPPHTHTYPGNWRAFGKSLTRPFRSPTLTARQRTVGSR